MVLLLQCIAVQSASRKKVNLAAATGAVTDDYESLITCDACLDDGLGWDPETRTCGHYPALPCPGGCANLRADSAAGRACDGGGLTSAHEVEDDDMEARIEAASRQHEDTPTSSRLWELISGNHVEDLVAWVEEEVRERRRGKQEIGEEPRSTLIPSRPNQFSAPTQVLKAHSPPLLRSPRQPYVAHVRSGDGRGPLFWAHEYGRDEIRRFLEKQGVDQEARDSKGNTPRMLKK